MKILRTEIRTGLLVVISLAALIAVLLYLGAPGVFTAQNTYRIFFDNAAGLKPGASVLLAGRKVGQVRSLYSPVPDEGRPTPKMEVLVEVQVAKSAEIYKTVKVQMTQTSLLGESVIDFTNGDQKSGLAPDGTSFLGERAPGLADAVPNILDKLDPALTKATATLDSLQETADNLTRLTAKDGDLPQALSEFKKFGINLNEVSGPDGSMRRTLTNLETMTGKDGLLGKSLTHISDLTAPDASLAKTLNNAERFTANLADNKDLDATLRNFRLMSENLNRSISRLGVQFTAVGGNLEEASDTLKHQPWRLIWPSTKKYPDEKPSTPIPVRRAIPVNRGKPAFR